MKMNPIFVLQQHLPVDWKLSKNQLQVKVDLHQLNGNSIQNGDYQIVEKSICPPKMRLIGRLQQLTVERMVCCLIYVKTNWLLRLYLPRNGGLWEYLLDRLTVMFLFLYRQKKSLSLSSPTGPTVSQTWWIRTRICAILSFLSVFLGIKTPSRSWGWIIILVTGSLRVFFFLWWMIYRVTC